MSETDEMRSSDALQIVAKLAKERLLSGQATLPDDEAYRHALIALSHVEKMVRCLKSGKGFLNCGNP
ncbi:MAG: hypothetical protein ABFR97_10790 [Thermodesulfobacteriota bacterium]